MRPVSADRREEMSQLDEVGATPAAHCGESDLILEEQSVFLSLH